MSDGAVYGDILSAFNELMDEYTVFNMQGKPGGGFTERTNERLVSGILRFVPGGKFGIETGLRTKNQVASFWAYEDEEHVIGQTAYLEHGNDLFLLTKDNGYKREGGFVKYIAAIVPGVTDKQVPNPSVVGKALDGYK